MSEGLNSRSLAGLLDRVMRLYPGGIPQEAITTQGVVSESPARRCVIVAVTESGALEKPLTDLAQAIGVKGLRLSSDRFVVHPIAASTFDKANIANLARELSASVVIICGSNSRPGESTEVGGTLVLYSFSLGDIASQADTKRQFWEQLKTVMPRLVEGRALQGRE